MRWSSMDLGTLSPEEHGRIGSIAKRRGMKSVRHRFRASSDGGGLRSSGHFASGPIGLPSLRQSKRISIGEL